MSRGKVAAILIARQSSARLPGKALAPVAGEPVVGHIIRRLRAMDHFDEICLATSNLPADQALVDVARKYGISSYAGHPEDVLDRMYHAARSVGADVVVEVGGDCPFVDPAVVKQSLEIFNSDSSLDYVCNVQPQTYPDGIDIHVASFTSLEVVHRKAILTSQRRHPFSYYYKHPDRFRCRNFENAENLSHQRWTLDYPEDLELIKRVFEALLPTKPLFTMDDVLKLLRESPEIGELNANRRVAATTTTVPAYWFTLAYIQDMLNDITRLSEECRELERSKDYSRLGLYYGEIENLVQELKERGAHLRISAEHQTVYRDERYYSTFPWVMETPRDGLVVAFRQASPFSAKAAKSRAVTHHDPKSWIAAVRSTDGGTTWPASTYRTIYKSRYGVNDPALTLLSNGQMLLRVCEIDVRNSAERHLIKGRLLDHRGEHGLVSAVRGNVVATLDPKTWKCRPGKLVECGELTASCSREPVMEFPDGSWGLSAYFGAPYTTDRAIFIRSFDGGKSWSEAVTMFHDSSAGESELQGTNFNETAVLDLGNGEMLAMARADESFFTGTTYMPVGGIGLLHVARSYNWGLSWTWPLKTPIFGQPAHLLKLQGDRVLCTYGYRKEPFGIRALISEDRGNTWKLENEIVLRDDAPVWDMGYPVTISIGGDLLTVYYFPDRDGTRYIASTRWRLLS